MLFCIVVDFSATIFYNVNLWENILNFKNFRCFGGKDEVQIQ